MVGRVLTRHGITRYGNGAYSPIGGGELNDGGRDELLQLRRQRLVTDLMLSGG
jgi:hypothetical protein